MTWILFCILCIASSITYRLGGTSAGTKWRDLGTTACLTLSLIVLGLVHGIWAWLSLILVFGMTMGAMTTYRYFLPKPKDANYRWWHYSLHGFMVSLADLPFACATGKWATFALRCVVCTAFVGAWSGLIGNDTLEESGRGFIFNVTRLIYLI